MQALEGGVCEVKGHDEGDEEGDDEGDDEGDEEGDDEETHPFEAASARLFVYFQALGGRLRSDSTVLQEKYASGPYPRSETTPVSSFPATTI
jgi:hypothetical protein